MNRVLILGGYGAVGREAAAGLAGSVEIIAAGRNPGSAAPVPGARMARVDVAVDADLARALEGVDAVLMCAELDNARIARACLERGVHYLDVTATPALIAAIEDLEGLARHHGATAILSVGLAPGVTNLLAKWCATNGGEGEVTIGVLLGSGEAHGPAAIRWTLDGLGELDGSWPMTFPTPYGTRTVHRFPFSDQFTLPRTIGARGARTGLCLDSRLTTALLTSPALGRLARRTAVRTFLEKALATIHLGGDAFAVTAQMGQVSATFTGRRQSRATGLTAALLLKRLPSFPAGVLHIDELVEPGEFLAELAGPLYKVDFIRG